MPPEARDFSLQKQKDSFYQDLVQVAFSPKYPMRLRWRALASAARFKPQRAMGDLRRASMSADWYLRNASLVSLAEINPQEGRKLARSLVKDKALVVRSAAVDVLVKQGLANVDRDLLWEELHQDYNFKKSQSLWIRPQIVEALARFPLTHERELFARLLNDKHTQIRQTAKLALTKLK